jgi:hypothetical protein
MRKQLLVVLRIDKYFANLIKSLLSGLEHNLFWLGFGNNSKFKFQTE